MSDNTKVKALSFQPDYKATYRPVSQTASQSYYINEISKTAPYSRPW
jgi:hypothetical protein